MSALERALIPVPSVLLRKEAGHQLAQKSVLCGHRGIAGVRRLEAKEGNALRAHGTRRDSLCRDTLLVDLWALDAQQNISVG